jgi:hypothetical protein
MPSWITLGSLAWLSVDFNGISKEILLTKVRYGISLNTSCPEVPQWLI